VGLNPPVVLGLEEVASGLSDPLYLTTPAGDSRLFVVEQRGRIRVIKNGQLLPTPFLDITSRVATGSEQGLLSVAFHPSYASNGFFYITSRTSTASRALSGTPFHRAPTSLTRARRS